MKHKIEVGQTVWVVKIRGGRRGDSELQEGVVSKVGRQYFYVDVAYRTIKVHIDTLECRTDWGVEARIHLSREQYDEEQRMIKMRSRIVRQFSTWGEGQVPLTNEQYERIYNIIMEGQQ